MVMYFYSEDGGTATAGATYRTLSAADRVVVGASAHLYSLGAGGRLFQLAANTRFDVAGQLLSDGDTLYALTSAATGVSLAVQKTGSVISNTGYALTCYGGSTLLNDGFIDAATGVRLQGNGNTVRNSGTLSGTTVALTIGSYGAGEDSSIANSGTIIATQSGSGAISLVGDGGFEITNTGDILTTNGTAISAGVNTLAAVYLTNSGTITGRLTLGAGNDVIVNTGRMTGIIETWAGDDTYDGRGSAVAATVNAGLGDDTLYGGSGNDYLIGGSGADLINGGAGTDTAAFFSDYGSTVDLADWTLNKGEALGDVLVSIERLVGGAAFDSFYGTDGGDERLEGGGGDDYLVGRGGDDVLLGGLGDDYLTGGTGRDRLDGGDGIDTAVYSAATSALTVNLGTTAWQNTGGAGRDRLIDIENLIGGKYADTLIGDYADNRIEGGDGNDKISASAGDDVVEGGKGDDTLNGGDGFDIASYASATDKVTVDLTITASQATIGGGNDTLTGFEGVIGGNYDDTLTGDSSANILVGLDGTDVLTGGGGADILNGGNGTDTLNGGAGNDTADYSGAEDEGVTVSLALTGAQFTGGAGTDTLTSIENLWGSSYDDVLTGNSGDNLLRGSDGNDTLNGGGGIDTADYTDAAGAVTVLLSLGGPQNTGGAGNDTLVSIENVIGSIFADHLIGSDGANRMEGGDGNDVLEGLGGKDRFVDNVGSNTFLGGDGIDTADYSNSIIGITVHLETATKTVARYFYSDTVIDVENFIGSDYTDTFISGSSVNTYTGGKGADDFVFAPGTATQNTITDFSGANGDGDQLIFNGYDAATRGFEKVDATHFRVFDNAHSEVITLANAPTINITTDVVFG